MLHYNHIHISSTKSPAWALTTHSRERQQWRGVGEGRWARWRCLPPTSRAVGWNVIYFVKLKSIGGRLSFPPAHFLCWHNDRLLDATAMWWGFCFTAFWCLAKSKQKEEFSKRIDIPWSRYTPHRGRWQWLRKAEICCTSWASSCRQKINKQTSLCTFRLQGTSFYTPNTAEVSRGRLDHWLDQMIKRRAR